MRHGKRREAVAVALEDVTRLELDEANLVRQLPDDALERAHQVGQPARPVEHEGKLAAPQREGLQQTGQAEHVVGVEVGDEDLGQIDEPNRRTEELPLGAFGAVEEQAVAAAPDEQRRGCPLGGRHRACGAQEDQVEIHRSILGFAPSSHPSVRPIALRERSLSFERGFRSLRGGALRHSVSRL